MSTIYGQPEPEPYAPSVALSSQFVWPNRAADRARFAASNLFIGSPTGASYETADGYIQINIHRLRSGAAKPPAKWLPSGALDRASCPVEGDVLVGGSAVSPTERVDGTKRKLHLSFVVYDNASAREAALGPLLS